METFAEFKKIVIKPQINYTSPWYARKVLRKFSPYITWVLVKFTPISANQVTLLQFIVSIIGLALLCSASLSVTLTGISLLHLGYLFDVIDGEVARYRKKTSLNGMFLDFVNHASIMPMTFGCLSFHCFFVSSSILYFYLGLGIILININPISRARQTTINYLIAKRKAPSYNIKNYSFHKEKVQKDQQESFAKGKVHKKNSLKKIKEILYDVFNYPNDIIIIAILLVFEMILGNAFLSKAFILTYFSYSSLLFIATLRWHINRKVVEKSFMLHIQECLELIRENSDLFENQEKEYGNKS